jgi:hypothetical protein
MLIDKTCPVKPASICGFVPVEDEWNGDYGFYDNHV